MSFFTNRIRREGEDASVLLMRRHIRGALSDEKERHSIRFQQNLQKALEHGGFEKLTERDFEEALNARSVLGLDVALPSKTEIQTVMFSRGRRLTTA